MLRLDAITNQAISHTAHCLVGCGIGETLGSAIGQSMAWHNGAQTALATMLAFVFGYALTFWGGKRMGIANRPAAMTALRTDTISILSMEVVDNSLLWIIPGAMGAAVASWFFWWSMAISLGVAFVVTVPVNRWLMARSGAAHHHGRGEQSQGRDRNHQSHNHGHSPDEHHSHH